MPLVRHKFNWPDLDFLDPIFACAMIVVAAVGPGVQCHDP
jgi:hypothetical protein